MPIFKIQPDGLVGLARVKAGPDLYEKEIEDLLWSNLEAFVGEDLFPVARQPTIRTGGIPDVVALDATGRVVVIEVKRSIERTQLAQCLEYAGWARTANLDELARLYSGGVESFFAAWQEFTKTATPLVVNPIPRLVLVAGRFDGRTADALAFLQDSNNPVELVPVTLYQDSDGDRIIHIDTEAEVELQSSPTTGTRSQPRQWKINGRRFEVGDLLEAGMIEVGEPLEWRRRDVEYLATVTEEGKLQLEDGRVFDTPSGAAMAVSGSDAVPGWEVWRLPKRDDRYIIELRTEYFERLGPDSASIAGASVEL
jgi:hypothetical protein